MRKLLNTLYCLTPDAYISLDGENVVVSEGGSELRRVPIHNIENIVCFGYQGASPALMRHAADCGVGLAFFTPNGRFLCRTEGEQRGNVLLRREQYRIADDESRSLRVAGNMIGAKIANSRNVLLRAQREHELQLGGGALTAAADALAASLLSAQEAASLNADALRGVEGNAAEAYFSVFDSMLLVNKADFVFRSRTRRPPTDRVNALLSFCYALMANECASALESVGLDPYVGFFHTDRPGRKSLALDLMEELRSEFCDRFVATIINLRQIKPQDFEEKENGAMLMDDAARRSVLEAWQKRRAETVVHPFLGEKCEWGLVPFVQAQLLARYVRGDIDDYPPFLWK